MSKKSVDPVQLCAEIAFIVALTEGLLMLVLPALVPGLNRVGESLVNVALLILLAGPALYWRCAAHLNPRLNASAAAALAQTTPHDKPAPFSISVAVGLTAAAQLLGLLATVAVVLWLKQGLDKDAQVLFGVVSENGK